MAPIKRFIHYSALLCAWMAATAEVSAQQPTEKPRIELVFCLDTTSSMGSLLDVAREKIWSISNRIARGQPAPALSIGLVAYRDKGEEYVTKVFDLTDDLDAVYGELMLLKAEGGGDFPEAVNESLYDAVHKISWSKKPNVLKLIFLVGDAPPKKSANPEINYRAICQTAARKNIIINAIQCGTHLGTRQAFQEISRLAEGAFAQLDLGGPVFQVSSPFDEELAEINRELAENTLTFGKGRFRLESEAKRQAAASLPIPTAATRAAYAARMGRAATYDLLDKIHDGQVRLQDLKKEELPKQLAGKTLEEQLLYLEQVNQTRQILIRRAVELDKKRTAFIQEQFKARQNAIPGGFDEQVLRILERQADRINLRFADIQQQVSPKR